MDLVPGEAPVVHDADPVPDRFALHTHRLAPGLVVAKAQPVGVVPSFAVEPEHPLPAADGPEHRAPGRERLVERGPLQRAGGGKDAMRVRDRVLQAVELDRPRQREVLRRPVAEAARIPGREVPFGLALGDPLRDRLAGRRGMGDADLNSAGVVEVRRSGGGAADRQGVGRIGDGAVDEPLHARLGKERDVGHRLVQHLGDVVHRIREELVGEVVRHAAGEGRPPGVSIGAEEQACPLAPQVEADVGNRARGERGRCPVPAPGRER